MNNTVLYLMTVFIWGTTWIAINYQLGDVAPEVSIVYRFALAAFVLLAYCHLKKLPMKFPPKKHLQFLVFGISLFSVNYFFLYMAQQHINSALTCIGFSTLMLVNIFNARIWFKTKITQQVYFGGAIGLFGIVTLFWPQISDVEFGQATQLGLALCLIGVLFASTGNMLSIKNKKDGIPIVQSNAWGMLYGALFMTVIALAQGKSFNFSYTLPYITSLLYLSIFGSVIAFGCYLSLMSRIGAHKTSYANIMFPAVAVVISTFVEGFSWTSYTFVGLGCILLGNLVVLARPDIFGKKSKNEIEQLILSEKV